MCSASGGAYGPRETSSIICRRSASGGRRLRLSIPCPVARTLSRKRDWFLSAHKDEIMLTNDPLWYKDAIIYELHVRAFHDSVGDGVGDFRGLTQKLDYLQDLGVTAIWLLPFYPSPLRDDGYDIADYTSINTAYGALPDFQELLAAAHERGI